MSLKVINRKMEGVEIPRATRSQLEMVFGTAEEPWQRAYLEDVGWMGVLSDPPMYPMLLSRLLDKEFMIKKWQVALAHPQLEFSSRIKNYLVAITTVQQGDGKRVAVVGSKSSTGGAMWQEEFEMYCAAHTNIEEIHYYDTGEIPKKKMVKGIKVEAFNTWYEGTGVEYDYVIDDAYIGGQGPSTRQWLSMYWSQKDHRDEQRPFFHEREARVFSHWKEFPRVAGVCRCRPCQHLSYTCADYAQFSFVSKSLVSMGSPNCVGVPNAEDLRARFEAKRQLEVKGVFRPRAGPQVRAAIAIMAEGNVKPSGTHGLSQSRGAKPVAFDHKEGWRQPEPESRLREWDGEQVAFVGMDSSILHGAKISMKVASQVWATHTFFSRDHRALHAVGSKYIWLEDNTLVIPPYQLTGRQFSGFYQYMRNITDYDVSRSRFSRLYGQELNYEEWMHDVPGEYKIQMDLPTMDEPTTKKENDKIYGKEFRVGTVPFVPLALGVFPYMLDCSNDTFKYDASLNEGLYYKVEPVGRHLMQVSRAEGCKIMDHEFTCDHYHLLRHDARERLILPGERVDYLPGILPILKVPLQGDYGSVVREFLDIKKKEEYDTVSSKHRARLKVDILYRTFESEWFTTKSDARYALYKQIYDYLRRESRF